MGRHKKVRTPEEEAAFREARLCAMRERQRQRQADPEYAARALEKKWRRRRDDPDYARRVRERDTVYKRMRRQDPVIREAEYERRRARDHDVITLTQVALTARSTRIVQGNRSVQRDQSTSCEKGVSKSTQASILTPRVSRRTQSEKVQDFHDVSSPSKVPLPSKGEPPLVTFLNRSAIAIRMLLHSNETQQCQAEGVIKQHPSDFRGHRLMAAGPTKVMEGIDAITQCCIAKKVADKTTWCTGISEPELYSAKVSCWTQSEGLEDTDDAS
uniref:Uncharacterized protein n=1 Tax=Rhipicephalus zambeziensis TaxID=60191 RepID=A0A224Y8X7_9ACAR